MRKHLIPETGFDRVWRKRKGKGHLELFASPSELAQEIWNYVLAIGTGKFRPGYDASPKVKRYGYGLHLVREGELIHTLDNRTFALRAGGVCLFDTAMPRRQQNMDRRPVTLRWLFFDGRAMRRVMTELRAAENPVFNGVDPGRFENLYHELWQLIANKPPAYEAKAHAVLSAMLAELFAARATDLTLIKSPESAAAVSEKVRMALDFVARLYTENIGLKHFAEAVHLNVHHFSRKFRQEIGMAPIQYLYHFRVEQAKRLLADTDRPVGEIARLVGIPDQRYFARLFHKHTGESPHGFRKQKRQNDAVRIEATRPPRRRKKKSMRGS